MRRWLVLCLTSWAFSAQAVERRGWIYEQMAFHSLATRTEQSRSQLQVSTSHYMDTASLSASGTLSLEGLEMKAFASRRAFGAFTAQGKELSKKLSGESSAFGLELARHFASPSGAFGRLALGAVGFFPANLALLKVGLDTGLFENELAPWGLELGLHFFLPVSGPAQPTMRAQTWVARVETYRNYQWGNVPVRIGGFFSWIDRHIDHGNGIGRQESMVFSTGPVAEVLVGKSRFQLQINLRLLLDKEIIQALSSMPSDLAPPDVSASWGLLL